MNYKLSIVIPVFNNYNFTQKCLEDLLKLPNDHQIIIVDNGSTDQTKFLSNDSPRVKIIRNKTNLGFARGVNIGWTHTDGEYVMFLNNDIRVKSNHEGWTKDILAAAESGGLVGPTIGILDSNFGFVCEATKMPSSGFVYMSGWNITAKNSVWESLILPEEEGPFNAGSFFSYFEDTDLSFRAKELGIPFKIVDCPVIHFGMMTSKKINIAEMYKTSKQKFISIWKDRVVR